MRDSDEVSFGRTKSFGGLVVEGGRGFALDVGGSGVVSFAGADLGLDRVRAILNVTAGEGVATQRRV